MPLVVDIGSENVLVGRDEESGGAAGRVENFFVFLRVDDCNDEVDDMARGAELPGVSLRAEYGEQVLEGISQSLAVVIGELVDDLEEGAQGLRVVVWQIGVLENVPEQWRDARILRHPLDRVGVEVEHVVSAQAGAQQLGPAETGELAGEECPLAAELLALGIQVVHELVDQGDGDLLDLALGVGHFPHEDVAGGVDAAFGFRV